MRSSVLVAVCAGMAMVLLVTASASATEDRWGIAQFFGAGNPGAMTLRLATQAPQWAMGLSMRSSVQNNLMLAAPGEEEGAVAGAAAPEGDPIAVGNQTGGSQSTPSTGGKSAVA